LPEETTCARAHNHERKFAVCGPPSFSKENSGTRSHRTARRTGTIRRDATNWAAYELDVQYVVIADAAHNANQNNPDFFNQVLRAFLQELGE
jgi:3-oxoadipate enol-lactonase